jgi:hypothetical protein
LPSLEVSSTPRSSSAADRRSAAFNRQIGKKYRCFETRQPTSRLLLHSSPKNLSIRTACSIVEICWRLCGKIFDKICHHEVRTIA